jgi:hypothetical protein
MTTQTCNEFREAIQVLTDLLHQAQAFSIQSPEEFRGRWQDVQIFVSRSQTVQDAIMNWNVGSQHARCTTAKKRARSGTLDVATPRDQLKRHRSEEGEDTAMTEGSQMTMMPIRPSRPAGEDSATQWWTQTLYD